MFTFGAIRSFFVTQIGPFMLRAFTFLPDPLRGFPMVLGFRINGVIRICGTTKGLLIKGPWVGVFGAKPRGFE